MKTPVLAALFTIILTGATCLIAENVDTASTKSGTMLLLPSTIVFGLAFKPAEITPIVPDLALATYADLPPVNSTQTDTGRYTDDTMPIVDLEIVVLIEDTIGINGGR